VSVRQVAAPLADGRALVRVAQAGICGTDLKIASGQIPVTRPRVLGHEMTGWVEVPGPRGAVPAGAPVLVNPAVFCGHCDLCRRDRPQLCRAGALLGRDLDGVFADLVAVDEAFLHPIPADLPRADGALLQVLSTCVHAQSALHTAPGDTAVVIGLGVSGLLHVQLLRDRGVRTIIGITRSEWKRDLALKFGASVTATPEEAEQAVADAAGGRGADIAIECAGTQPTLAQAMRLAGAGGTVLVFGTIGPAVANAAADPATAPAANAAITPAADPAAGASTAPAAGAAITPAADPATAPAADAAVSSAADPAAVPGVAPTAPAADAMPTYDWYFKELTIRNTRAARPRDCDLAIQLAAERRLDLAPLVTARFPLEQANHALAVCADPAQLKVVLDIAGPS
jgi:threonine dehydrogenase-like Zn-dependent dehydrogenase